MTARSTTRHERLLGRIRTICFALPEVTERPSHGAPTWFVRDKKVIATFWGPGAHKNYDFFQLWCPAEPGVQELLIESDAARFFRPPYAGPAGWAAIKLHDPVPWDHIADLCESAYRKVAPKRLVALLDNSS